MARPESRASLGTVADAVVVYDAETGAVIDANEQGRDLFGDRNLDAAVRTSGKTAPTAESLLSRARTRGVRIAWTIETPTGDRTVEADVRTEHRAGTEVAIAKLRQPPASESPEDDGRPDDQYRDQYRALFETGQFALWEFDFSLIKRRLDDLPVAPATIPSYLQSNPEIHQRLLADIKVRDVNEAAVDLYGANSREHLMANVDRVMTESSINTLAGLWEQVAAGRTDFRAECQARTFDGEDRWVIIECAVPESAANYAPTYIIVIDITERKRRATELQQLKQEYEALVKNVEEALFLVDVERTDDEGPTFRLQRLNPVGERLFGLTSEAVQGQTPRDVLGDEIGANVEENYRRCLDAGEVISYEETIELDGDRRVLQTTLSPIELDGTISHIAGVSHDITERKHRIQELERKTEQLDEVARVVAHDVATPLCTIRNRAELARRTVDPEHAEIIQEEVDRVQRLIQELRQLAERSRRVNTTRPVDLETVAREAWREVASPPGLECLIETSRTVDADVDRLRRLLRNLMENAAQHAVPDDHATDDPGDDGPITLRVGAMGDGFYVEDDGRGFPDQECTSVFERGYTTSVDGSGLGLTIVRRIAESHGWDIETMESADGGARIEITVE